METLLEYECPSCGGTVAFDAQLQKIKCPYCESIFELDQVKPKTEKEASAPPAEDPNWSEQMNSYVCQSCGGEILCDANTAVTSCPYCESPVVMKGRLEGALRPDLVIPFKLDKKAAIAALNKHYGGKKLLPKIFSSQNHIEEVKGIYVPFWLFDADADAQIRYKASKIRSWSDSRYNFTETSYFSVVRAGDLGFERVPVDGSSKIDDTLMESLEPYNFADAVDFQTAYLAGYLADKYDVNADTSRDRANERIRQSTEQAFARTVTGYSTVIPEHTNIQLNNGTAKYALYPVWILNTKWNNQTFTFGVNGQTGKVAGNLPMDKGAFWAWLWGVAGAVTDLIKQTNPDAQVQTARAEGLRECRKLMTLAKAGKYNGYLIEGMACPGGCVAGAGTLLPVEMAANVVVRYQKDAATESPLESPYRDKGETLD